MEFFVPACDSAEEAEKVWEATRTFAQESLGWGVGKKRIFRITGVHDGKAIGCEVGKAEPYEGDTVIAILESLDCDRLREATRGDGEVIEKADVAEQDQAEAVPAIDESDRGFPLVSSAGIVVVVQAQGDGLVAGDDGATADGVQFPSLIVGQVKTKLVR
ncbi:MAG TPA: hypothetical protein VF093_11260 [Solirubrobacterales bacterium]